MTFTQPVLSSCLAMGLLLGLGQSAAAQGNAAPSRVPDEPAAQSGEAAPAQRGVDVSRLPIDVRRIQRELAQRGEREEFDGRNLRYFVDVFGQAPAIQLFTEEDNLLHGQAPYGAPTHRDMIYMMTPPEFRSPVMDFSGLMRWLSDKARK
jgi:hypothetical protein